MVPIFETTTSNDRSGRPVPDASAVTHVSDLPATSALCVPIAISLGVMSTAVTRAPGRRRKRVATRPAGEVDQRRLAERQASLDRVDHLGGDVGDAFGDRFVVTGGPDRRR
jgi:hypothetical protein